MCKDMDLILQGLNVHGYISVKKQQQQTNYVNKDKVN